MFCGQRECQNSVIDLTATQSRIKSNSEILDCYFEKTLII